MESSAKIKLETDFANAAYQDFKSKRFGLTPCCFFDLQSIYIKRQACNWEELQTKVLNPSSLMYSTVDCTTIPPTPETPTIFPPDPPTSTGCIFLTIQIWRYTAGTVTVTFTNCADIEEILSFVNIKPTTSFTICKKEGTLITYNGQDDYAETISNIDCTSGCFEYSIEIVNTSNPSFFTYINCELEETLYPVPISPDPQTIIICGPTQQIVCNFCQSMDITVLGPCP